MEQASSVEQVTPDTASWLLAEGAMLIDVREPEEWSAGRAPQAVHIPLGELGARLGEIDGQAKVVVICRSGARSDRAAQALVGHGLSAVNLAGGMQAWQAASLPVVKDGGEPGVVV